MFLIPGLSCLEGVSSWYDFWERTYWQNVTAAIDLGQVEIC